MALNLADLIEHAIDATPHRNCLLSARGNRTFAELEDRANRLAHALQARGVGVGDKVGIYSRNLNEAIEAMVATFKIRAVMVNINFRYVAPEVIHLVNDSDMVAMVCERRYLPTVIEAFDDCPKLTSVLVVDADDPTPPVELPDWAEPYEAVLAEHSPERDFDERSADDIFIVYTGGTTGHPKGVMWRHEDAWRMFGGGINVLTAEYVPDEWTMSQTGAAQDQVVRFPVPPFIHGAAQWAIFSSLFNCGAAVLLPDFDGHQVWQYVEKYQVNVMMMTGDAMARPLLEALDEGRPGGGNYRTDSLTALTSTAVLFSPALQEQFVKWLPDTFITDAIGASEYGFNGVHIVNGQKAAGPRPTIRPGLATTVLDENGQPIEPGSGEIGVLARSGHIALGYYKDEAKTAATFVEYDGVRYAIPGDLATIDADGNITVLGRGSTSINTGGEKIFPDEVEAAVRAHPEVVDALVIGVPDERWGERVAVIVVREEGSTMTLDDLNKVTRERIAGYKVPRSIWFVDDIKRSPAGKSDLRWAKRFAADNPPDEVHTVRSA